MLVEIQSLFLSKQLLFSIRITANGSCLRESEPSIISLPPFTMGQLLKEGVGSKWSQFVPLVLTPVFDKVSSAMSSKEANMMS